MSCICPHLRPENADELLAAAAHKTKAEVERLLAERFPQADLPTLVCAVSRPMANGEPAASTTDQLWQLSPGTVAGIIGVPALSSAAQQVDPTCAQEMAVPSERVATESPARARLAPLSPGRFAWQVTVDQETHDLLRYAQSLLGHAVPSGDVEAVLERALDALVEKLERQKFAKSARSRPRHGAAKGRHIPAEVRRTVWQRDSGRCTFVSEQGRRC